MQRLGWQPGIEFELHYLGGVYTVFLEKRA
jgi:hypothetical protein